MNKNLFSLLVLLFFLLATATARPPARKAWAEGFEVIQNISDPNVIKTALFAISEYDKTTIYPLEFIKVVNGTILHIYYYPDHQDIWFLYLEAKNCSQPGNIGIYRTQVDVVSDHRNHPRDSIGFAGLWKASV